VRLERGRKRYGKRWEQDKITGQKLTFGSIALLVSLEGMASFSWDRVEEARLRRVWSGRAACEGRRQPCHAILALSRYRRLEPRASERAETNLGELRLRQVSLPHYSLVFSLLDYSVRLLSLTSRHNRRLAL
jgi:hypothetical protein